MISVGLHAVSYWYVAKGWIKLFPSAPASLYLGDQE